MSGKKNVTINLQFKDRLGSGFKNYQYAVTTTQSTPSSWANGGTNVNSNISIVNSGTWYLHVKATDNAGNQKSITETVTNIDKNPPLLKLKSKPDENGKIKIIWETEDTQSGVRNLILPNGKYSSEVRGEFIAEQNGIYRFTSYDKVGNYAVMEIEVDNIDTQGIIFSLWKKR